MQRGKDQVIVRGTDVYKVWFIAGYWRLHKNQYLLATFSTKGDAVRAIGQHAKQM